MISISIHRLLSTQIKLEQARNKSCLHLEAQEMNERRPVQALAYADHRTNIDAGEGIWDDDID